MIGRPLPYNLDDQAPLITDEVTNYGSVENPVFQGNNDENDEL